MRNNDHRPTAGSLPMWLLAILVITACLPAVSGGTKVFILAGQSNMAGRAFTRNLPVSLQTPPSNVFTTIRSATNAPMRYRNSFGPEVSFAAEMARDWPNDRILIVKHAIGGTSALAWSPDWSSASAKITKNQNQGPLYDQLMKLVRPLAENPENEILAVLWAQGGRDARFAPAWNSYQRNLTAIISSLRKDLNRPSLPFLLAETVNAPEAKYPGIKAIRKAQRSVAAEVPLVKFISSEGLKTLDDHTHFNAKGQVELGRRFARAFREVTDSRSTKSDTPPEKHGCVSPGNS